MSRTFALLLAFALPLAACDADDETGDDGVIETADDAGGTDGEDAVDDEDAAGDTAAGDEGAGTTGDDNAGMTEPALDLCDEYGAAQACPTGGTRYCDDFDGELAWGECVSKAVCQFGDTRSCGLSDSGVSMGCTLDAGVPTWDEAGCG